MIAAYLSSSPATHCPSKRSRGPFRSTASALHRHTAVPWRSCLKHRMEELVVSVPPTRRCYVVICLLGIMSEPLIIYKSHSGNRCNEDDSLRIYTSSI